MKFLSKSWGWIVAAITVVAAVLLSVMAKDEAAAQSDGVTVNAEIMEKAGLATRDQGSGAQAGAARIFSWTLETIREGMSGLGWSALKQGSMISGLATAGADLTGMIPYWIILEAKDSNTNNAERIDDSDGVALVAYLSDNYGSE